MNKFVAKIMSIIMLVTAVTTNLNYSMFVQDVYANSMNFNYSYTRSLTEGPSDSIPIEGEITKNDTVWLEWGMNDFDGGTFSNGTFEMTYPLRDGVEVLFTIQKVQEDKAYVEYRLIDSATSTPLPTTTYEIFTHREEKYVPFTKFISSGYNSAEENYQVLDTDEDGNPIDYPRFILSPERGFSIKYNNVNFHIYWGIDTDGKEKMVFYTDKLPEGKIIEPTLTVTVSGITKEDTLKLSSGISKSTFEVKPFANEDMYVEDTVTIVGDEATDDLFPANEEQDKGVKISFDPLLEWDDTTNTFTKKPDYKVPVKISLTAVDDDKNVSIEIDDTVAFGGASAVEVSPAEGASVKSATQDPTTGRIDLEIRNLNSGIIYNPSVIYVLSDPAISGSESLKSNSTKLDFGDVFTFPHYQVLNQNNKLYIVVEPFEGYAGEYLLKTGDSPQEVSSRQESDGVKPSIFPLSINPQNEGKEFYQLFFSPGKKFDNTSAVDVTNSIHSQKLEYKATAEDNGLSLPNNFYVVDYNHIQDDSVTDFSKGFVEFTLRWDIGQEDNIQNLLSTTSSAAITYTLSSSLTPDSEEISQIATINMDLQLNDDGTITVTYSGGDDGDSEDYISNYIVNTEPEILEYKYQADMNDNMYFAEVTFLYKTAIIDYAGSDIDEIYFRYPNIYFLTVQPTNLNGSDIHMASSIFQSITLNYIEDPELNPPQNLNLTDNTFQSVEDGDAKDEVSFKVNFSLSGQAMKEYLLASYSSDELESLLDETKFKTYFNIYITENEEELVDNFPLLDYDQRLKYSEQVKYDPSYNKVVYLSDINGNSGVVTSKGEYAIDVLRNDEVLSITEYPIPTLDLAKVIETGANFTYSLKLDGLDSNTKYYVMVDLVAEDLEKGTLDYSELTPAKAITTKSSTTVPKPGENFPNAPELEEIETTTDTTVLGWDRIIPEETGEGEENIEIEYEIIKLKDVRMDEQYLNTRENFAQTWNEFLPATDKEGFRTNKLDIDEYNGTSFETANPDYYQYSPQTTPMTFTDRTLVPNTVYYYYIRTVKIIDGEELYSVWNRVSVTTSNLTGPINLIALFEDYDKNIDLQTEVYLQFDAPIIDLTQLTSIYDIELAVLKDGGEWGEPIKLNPNDLETDGTISEDGYRTFVYKVEGLEPGTSYSFKVRMTLKDGGGSSLYSNVVRIRTENDQDDYDLEGDIDDWTEYIKDKLEEILNGDYWEISNTSNEKEILYREDKFDGLLQMTNDSFLDLVPAEIGKTNHYYIPVDSIVSANNKKIGLRVQVGDNQVILSSGAVDPSLNNALKNLSQDIKEENIQDYYIDIIVRTEETKNKVDGKTTSSPIIEAKIETKAFDIYIEEFEADIYYYLMDSFLEEELEDLINEEVEDILLDELTNEEIIKVLDKKIEEFAEDVFEEVKKEFERATSPDKYNVAIEVLNKPMMISNPKVNNTSIAEGYRRVGDTWINEYTTTFGNKDLIVSPSTGTFVFVNTGIIISNVGDVEDAKVAHEILVKYNLFDILKDTSGTVNADEPVTRYEAYASIARILGNKSNDPVAYLNSLGIQVSTRNMHSVITQEELTELVMNVYEYKTHTNVENYQIKNYAKVSSITNVNNKYLKSVQVAVDLGIVDINQFSPKQQVSTEYFLNTLLKVDNIVGL